MGDELKRAVESPDRKHVAVLSYIDEIRYGPSYFSLSVDGVSFGVRIFGDVHLWSGDSRFFAVQEWMTTDYRAGPVTQLLLIDVAERRERPLAVANQGWVIPERFEGDRLIYTEHYYSDRGREKVMEFEAKFVDAGKWRSL
ncbi:MAG TPA: hypothetical protein VNI02_10115 [Blastocatellia bacterium]|jgi:hypothetical protein|nr:hypothetical protein [Blastocatellia bacterium]